MDSKPFKTGCLKIHSPILLNLYGVVLALGVKRSGCEADHTALFVADVKKEWSNNSTPSTRFYYVMMNDFACEFIRQSPFSFTCAVTRYCYVYQL
jgi:hypothetical protein